MGFWDRVNELVTKENTSYAYIAGKIGKSESTVSGWHRTEKKKIPEADMVVTIAQILHTTVEYLVTGQETAFPGLSPEAIEIARAADRLSPEGRNAALKVVRGMESEYPLGTSKSTSTAT
jgi:transcriptional regulator with XRE-family HTH domain